jgi:hypothetical protein
MEKLEIARRSARATFRAETKKADAATRKAGLSPAAATKAAAAKSGLPASRLVPVVAAVYYEGNGLANPVAKRRGVSLAKAVRIARDAGGRLGRWEVLSYRFASYGRERIPVASLRALYVAAEGDLDASYTGRGTRVGAPKTREDETVEATAAA